MKMLTKTGKYALVPLVLLFGSIYPVQISLTKADFEPIGVKTTTTPTVETPLLAPTLETVKTREVWVTAYTSTPEETDDTPFVTASGHKTGDGIIASNFLPFGTKVRIPTLFGAKVFVVEDRMAKRMVNRVDVWMAEKETAMHFGIRQATIEILD